MLNLIEFEGGVFGRYLYHENKHPHEWDWCSHERDPTELPSPFHHMKI